MPDLNVLVLARADDPGLVALKQAPEGTRITVAYDVQDAARWDQYEPLSLGGRTVGIVGLGDIGRAVAARLRPLGLRVVGLRRSGRPDPAADEVLPASRLLDLARGVDDLIVATPLTPE